MHKVTFELEKDILEANRKIASANSKRLAKYGIRSCDFQGAIGSGKTSIIKRLAKKLKSKGKSVAAIAGDCFGKDDYREFKKIGLVAININTGKECHLDAHLVEHALDELPLKNIDVLFVENVGNLICPADFALGMEKRVVVISVTEGKNMIRKHPVIFGLADVTVLNKIELADIMNVNIKNLEHDFKKINPHGNFLCASAKTGKGITELMRYLGL
ncbi:MAG: hydrogenase nickel incorporation protein HypB [Candidatus Thermoplasmatota archaeon]|nr:hydrogenase nickel incorporation protein HypB [Candidatus Thermoplasmatota archaeon]